MNKILCAFLLMLGIVKFTSVIGSDSNSSARPNLNENKYEIVFPSFNKDEAQKKIVFQLPQGETVNFHKGCKFGLEACNKIINLHVANEFPVEKAKIMQALDAVHKNAHEEASKKYKLLEEKNIEFYNRGNDLQEKYLDAINRYSNLLKTCKEQNMQIKKLQNQFEKKDTLIIRQNAIIGRLTLDNEHLRQEQNAYNILGEKFKIDKQPAKNPIAKKRKNANLEESIHKKR